MQLTAKAPRTVLLIALLGCLAALGLTLAVASAPASAKGEPQLGGAKPARAIWASRHKRSKRRGRAALAGARAISHSTVAAPAPVSRHPALLEAGFETGLTNWNTAGVGEVLPTVTSAIAREGTNSCRVALTGNQGRSELILGGNGGGSTKGEVEFHEGDEYWYGFSVYLAQVVYGQPGAHNLFMQFKSDGEGSPNFGLQLWDVHGERGLWSAGDGMENDGGGERFLAPMAEGVWHDIQIHFKASSVGAGFYEIFLDGNLVDAKTGASMIVPGHSSAYIKNGLYRNGETDPGTEEIFLDAAKLGTTQESVLPD